MDARLKAFPKEFTERLQKIYPPGVLPSVLRSYLEPRQTTLRVNTLKSSIDTVAKDLSAAGFSFDIDRKIPNCLYLKDFSQKKLISLDCYEKGWVYLQNVSCQLPAYVLNPSPTDRILDLCASPGGKTSHLAALMKNGGSITALEPDRIRFERLKHNLSLLGVTSATCLQTRGESFCRQLLATNGEKFDKVLVDAPCSGDGTFYVNDRASFTHWSSGFVQEAAKTQFKLLSSAFTVTKKGGLVLYTTCSTSPEENELLVDLVIKDRGVKIKTELMDISLFNKELKILQPPLMSWNNLMVDVDINKCRRIFPSYTHDGFFLAPFRLI